MNFKEIQELIKLVSKSDLTEFKMKQTDFELTIKTGKGIKPAEYPALPYGTVPAAPVVVPPVAVAAPVQKASPAEAPPVAKSETPSKYIEIKSPMVGTFYRSAGPDKPPFVKVGDAIDVGTTVCIVEAMKLFNEIESEVKGTIVKVMVEDASPVEYDQVLFLVEP